MRSPSLCAEERRLCAMENLQPVSSEATPTPVAVEPHRRTGPNVESTCGAKRTRDGLWHAIDHHSGQGVSLRLRDADRIPYFFKRQAAAGAISAFHAYDTDGVGAYERHIDTEQHRVGKDNTQKIASKHMNLRTRITR